jgi:hypothetical protein
LVALPSQFPTYSQLCFTYMSRFVEKVREEWEYIKVPSIWIGITIGVIMQWVSYVCHNLVFYLVGKHAVFGGRRNQLFDFGFIAFGSSVNELKFRPANGILYSMGLLSLIFIISPLFTDVLIRDKSVRSVQILWRALIVISISIVFRCVSFLVTLLPAPAEHCSEQNFNPPRELSDIFTWADFDHGCSDLLFSSHMIYSISFAYLITLYTFRQPSGGFQMSSREIWLKRSLIVLMWSLVICQACLIIAQQSHYTVDVWTALYVVPLCWIAFQHYVPNDPIPKATDLLMLEKDAADEASSLLIHE